MSERLIVVNWYCIRIIYNVDYEGYSKSSSTKDVFYPVSYGNKYNYTLKTFLVSEYFWSTAYMLQLDLT